MHLICLINSIHACINITQFDLPGVSQFLMCYDKTTTSHFWTKLSLHFARTQNFFAVLHKKSDSRHQKRERFYAFIRLCADFIEALAFWCVLQQLIQAYLFFCEGSHFWYVVLAKARHLARPGFYFGEVRPPAVASPLIAGFYFGEVRWGRRPSRAEPK